MQVLGDISAVSAVGFAAVVAPSILAGIDSMLPHLFGIRSFGQKTLAQETALTAFEANPSVTVFYRTWKLLWIQVFEDISTLNAFGLAALFAATVLGFGVSMKPHASGIRVAWQILFAQSTAVRLLIAVVLPRLALATFAKSSRTTDLVFELDAPIFFFVAREIIRPWKLLLT
jgi:hypothetical protein